MKMDSYWLLPLLFVWHDFEELVLVPRWLRGHNPYIGKRVLFGGVHRSDILAVGVWEELCLFILVAAVAYWGDYPLLVLAASVPYFLHLVMHLILLIIKQAYVPGAVTSVLELPIGGLYILNLSRLIHESLLQWALVITVAIVIFVMNLGVIHWGMAKLMRHF